MMTTNPHPAAGDDSDTILLELPATHKYLNVLGAVLAEVVLRVENLQDPNALYNVQLAVHEACTNIVDHAYDGVPGRIQIRISLDVQTQELVVTLQDNGRTFDPTLVNPPDLEKAQVRGYGLHLMQQLLDEVTYIPLDQGNFWRLVKVL